MKEIPQQDPLTAPPYRPSGAQCPRCKAPMVFGPVPCPDGKPGCLVYHQGYTCMSCRRQFAG